MVKGATFLKGRLQWSKGSKSSLQIYPVKKRKHCVQTFEPCELLTICLVDPRDQNGSFIKS